MKVFVELPITWFSLVALSYQLSLNISSRIYIVYELIMSTTHHYYGHNRSYLTHNSLDWIIPTKQTKNK